MTKGIRDFISDSFLTNLPKFQSGELTGTQFRRTVMDATVNQFQISVASASTHYNFCLKSQRANDPESVAGLGREEGKKGGRKVLHPVTVVKVKDNTVVVAGVSREKAVEMVRLAAETKGKAKLKILEDEVQPEAASA